MAMRFSMGDSLIEGRPKKTRQDKEKESIVSTLLRVGTVQERDTEVRVENERQSIKTLYPLYYYRIILLVSNQRHVQDGS